MSDLDQEIGAGSRIYLNQKRKKGRSGDNRESEKTVGAGARSRRSFLSPLFMMSESGSASWRLISALASSSHPPFDTPVWEVP